MRTKYRIDTKRGTQTPCFHRRTEVYVIKVRFPLDTDYLHLKKGIMDIKVRK